jgi:hypothetical protein
MRVYSLFLCSGYFFANRETIQPEKEGKIDTGDAFLPGVVLGKSYYMSAGSGKVTLPADSF